MDRNSSITGVSSCAEGEKFIAILSSENMCSKDRASNIACVLKGYREQLLRDHQGKDRIDSQVYDLLAVELCRLAKMIIPNVHQKIDEIIVAADEPATRVVSVHPYGPDLVDPKSGVRTEVKVSVCTAEKRMVNFNWSMPSRRPEEDDNSYSNRVVHAIQDKTQGGGAILRAVTPLNEIITEYHLSSAFLIDYFDHVARRGSKTHKHNMRSERCSRCNTFHRLEHLAYWSRVHGRDKSSIDWNKVLTRDAIDRCS